MATKKSTSRKVKKTLKKLHPAYIFIAVFALIAGVAVGYFGASFISGKDVLEVKGEKVTVVKAGETVTYADEGIKYISNGEDLSSKYLVADTNMEKDANGNYVGTATEDEELYIVYRVTAGRAEGETVYRVFRVETESTSAS